MLRNIGNVDQVIRAILGLAFIAFTAQDGISASGAVVSAMAGAYLLATAIFLYCPGYAILGFSTRGRIDSST